MRGKLAKAIRRHADKRFAFLSETPLYRQGPSGTIRLVPQCRRFITQNMKRNYTRQKEAV